MCSNWSNSLGHFKVSPNCNVVEDISHMMTCQGLSDTRDKLYAFTTAYCDDHPLVAEVVKKYIKKKCRLFIQFLLDCSTLPEVILLVQKNGNHVLEHLFNITRLWCYCVHRDRLKILGRWKDFMKA